MLCLLTFCPENICGMNVIVMAVIDILAQTFYDWIM